MLGLGGMVYMFYMLWGAPLIWAVIPISLMVVGMGIVPLELARKLASPVIVESHTRLVVGMNVHTIDGNERCEIKRWPNLAYVQLTLSGGVEVLFIPGFSTYYEIQQKGASAWWREIVNVRC
jgi:hypothetical protein